MKLKFDSIAELEQFLMFSAHIGSAFQTAPLAGGEPAPKVMQVHDEVQVEPASSVTGDLQSVREYAAELANAPTEQEQAEQPAEKPKRTRRTKAETEAERAGNAAAVVAAPPADGSATTSAALVESVSTQAAGNPFAAPSTIAPAMQAILDAPNQVSALAAAATATQNAETAPAETAPAEQAAATAFPLETRAAQIAEDPAAVDQFAHLKACQAFIQRHGMNKYNESFTNGLNANIVAYQPEQRALHLAILESLEV